jgi:hypothetical protein
VLRRLHPVVEVLEKVHNTDRQEDAEDPGEDRVEEHTRARRLERRDGRVDTETRFAATVCCVLEERGVRRPERDQACLEDVQAGLLLRGASGNREEATGARRASA